MLWLENGLWVMLYGMGTVFGFLILLVFLMNGAAWFFKTFAHWFPEEEAPKVIEATKKSDDAEIAVAIAAIQAFKSK